MYLTDQNIAEYQRDEYLLVPLLISQREVGAMLSAVESSGRVAQTSTQLMDATGKATKLAIWSHLGGKDVWTPATTSPRIVNAVRILLGEEIAFLHGKVLQVLRGSPRLGRLNHVQVGTQSGANLSRIKTAEKMFERVYCEITPGSCVFFHSNLLRTSGPNESEKPRRSFVMYYSALANPQLAEKQTSEQCPCPVGPDDAIAQYTLSFQFAAGAAIFPFPNGPRSGPLSAFLPPSRIAWIGMWSFWRPNSTLSHDKT